MTIMPCRLQNLYYLIEGFAQAHVPLIGYNATGIVDIPLLDDIGIYVLIPQLVRLCKISLPSAINLFFYGLIGIASALGIVGFFLLYKQFVQRIVVAVYLSFLLYFMYRHHIGDVYVAYFASVLGVVPLFLYFIHNTSTSLYCYGYMLFSGIFLGVLQYVRAYSGLATVIFIVSMILTVSYSYQKKITLLSLLFLGMAISCGYFRHIVTTYEAYKQASGLAETTLHLQHPFWHTLYLGFGFLKFENRDNIEYLDEYAFEKARSQGYAMLPPLLDATYESILKHEVYALVRKQPFFVLFTVFAKMGILFFFLLVFANIGLLRLFFGKPLWKRQIAFFGSFVISALFPIMVVPSYSYALCFITFATIYGIVSLNELLSVLFGKKIICGRPWFAAELTCIQ